MFEHRSARFAFLFWFALTTLVVGAMQFTQARSTGGLGGLLGVGDEHGVRHMVESEIPGVPSVPGIGHDGQLFYVIARDPAGQSAPRAMEAQESPAYRYRRIGYPAISGAFGALEGTTLVWSMAAVNALSAGLAAGLIALIARLRGLTPWLAVGILLNPGVWLSGRLLTSDNLALAAGLAAVYFLLRSRLPLAVAALALAALTKEVALVFALGLAIYCWSVRQRRTAVVLVIGASLALVAWLGYVHTAIGNVFDSSGNLALPFMGMIEATGAWPEQRLRDNVWIGFTLLAVVGGLAALRSANRLWRSLLIPWIAVALVSSELVWNVGNNAIRTLAALIPLAAFAFIDRQDSADGEAPAATPASP